MARAWPIRVPRRCADASFSAAFGKLEAESALSESRFAHDTDDARLAIRGIRQFGFERFEFRGAAGQRAEMRPAAESLARRGIPDAQQPENLDRLRQAADRSSAERCCFDELPGRRLRVARQENFTWLRHLFHAGREMRRRTGDVIGQVEAVFDRLDDDHAGVHPDPDLHILVPEPGDGCLHGQRRRAGAQGMILMRARGSEERHDAVASHLVDHAVVAIDGTPHRVDRGLQAAQCILGIGTIDETRRIADVGKDQGQALALTTTGAEGPQRLVRRRQDSGPRGQSGTACAAKTAIGAVDMATGRACRPERLPAAVAERIGHTVLVFAVLATHWETLTTTNWRHIRLPPDRMRFHR